MKEIYFQLVLTENEHNIIESRIRDFCYQNKFESVYYRKLPVHIPMFREIKIKGNVGQIKKFLADQNLEYFSIFKNDLADNKKDKVYIEYAKSKMFPFNKENLKNKEV